MYIYIHESHSKVLPEQEFCVKKRGKKKKFYSFKTFSCKQLYVIDSTFPQVIALVYMIHSYVNILGWGVIIIALYLYIKLPDNFFLSNQNIIALYIIYLKKNNYMYPICAL